MNEAAENERLILVSNDDGIYAAGVRALAAALASVGEVWVVAPDREQSAASHSLTLNRPLRVEERGERRLAVDGTPTDCINLAVNGLLSRRPALVVSGINHGGNLGDDVTYSGTVSAAMEGTLLGIPSFAVSQLLAEGVGFGAAATFAARLARAILDRGLPPETLLNVNVPARPDGELQGYAVTRQGKRRYGDAVVEKTDPRGRKYYWIGGDGAGFVPDTGTDFDAVERGCISITPLHLDLTHRKSIEFLENFKIDWP